MNVRHPYGGVLILVKLQASAFIFYKKYFVFLIFSWNMKWEPWPDIGIIIYLPISLFTKKRKLLFYYQAIY